MEDFWAVVKEHIDRLANDEDGVPSYLDGTMAQLSQAFVTAKHYGIGHHVGLGATDFIFDAFFELCKHAIRRGKDIMPILDAFSHRQHKTVQVFVMRLLTEQVRAQQEEIKQIRRLLA